MKRLKVFITTVMANVAGGITSTPNPMRRGLTSEGTSSPLFKVFIIDLPRALREMIKTEFPKASIPDPALLASEDVIALSVTLEQMQAIADECCRWAKENRVI